MMVNRLAAASLLLLALAGLSPASAQVMSCPDLYSARGACVPIAGNASGTTGSVVGTLTPAAGKTAFVCDFDVSAIGGTAPVGPIVVAGLIGGSKTYQLSASAAGVTLSKSFNPCLAASAINTAITITTTADGTATAVNVNSSGYQQ